MSNSHRRLSIQRWSTNGQRQVLQFTRRFSFQRCSTNCQGQVLQFTPKTFAPALLHQLSRTGSPPTVNSNSHRRLSFQRCSTNCQGQVLQFTPKTFAPALLHQLSRTGSPIQHRRLSFRAAPPTVKDRISNSHRGLSSQRCSTNCQGQVSQFTPKTFAPALLHQQSRTGSPIHTEDFRPSAAPPTVKDRFSNSLSRLSFQRCSTNCQGQVLQLTPKTFAPALLHRLSRTGSPIHTEDSRSSTAAPTVKDRYSNSHRRLSFQRCSTDCQGQVLQFTPKTFAAALLHQLSRTGSPIHTEDFRSSAAPPTVKDRFSNSHRRLSQQRCSTNCQGQVLQFTPKTFVPALLHQLSRTGSPIHTEDFRSSAAPPTVKNRISNSHRRLSLQRCSTNCQGQDLQFTSKTFVPRCSTNCQGQDLQIHIEDFRPSAAPPTVKDRFSNSHRRRWLQRCSTNCQGQVLKFTPKTLVQVLLHQMSRTGSLQFTPKTFAPALLHQLSRTRSPIHTEDFRPSAAPPTVKDRFPNSHRRLSLQRCSTNCQDRFSNSHRRLSSQRCSTNCQGQVLQFALKTFAPALLHQLSRKGSSIHTEDFRSSAAPSTVKDRISNSHRRLSFQRCSTNCQGQDLQFTPKTFVPADLQFTPKTFAPTLFHQLSWTGSPIHTEDFRSSAAPPTVKDRFSNLHRRLSLQRVSSSPIHTAFVPALLHQLSRTGSPIHTEDFRSSAAPPTVKDRISNSHEDFRSSAAPPTVKDRFSNSHRKLSLQRCSTNCQGQVLQFTPKTFAPALLHQLSRTGSPIHTEDFRSSAAPPTVKDRLSNSHRRLSLQRWSTNGQRQVLQFTPKTFVPALLHQLSRTGSPIHTEDFRSSAAPPTVKDRFSNSHRRLSFQRCSTNCQGQVLQFTPKTFAPALLHQLSRASPIPNTEDFRSSAAPPTVKDRFSNSHRRLSSQRCSTNCQGQVLQFTPKTFAPALLHQLSRTGSPIHTEDFRPSAAPPTVKDRFSNSHSKTFAPALLHQLSRTGSPIHTEDFRSSAAPPTVKDRFSNSHRRLSLQRCSTNCQGQVLQFTPKTFAPALLHQLSRTGSPIHTEDFRSSAAPPTVKDRFLQFTRRPALLHQRQVLQFRSSAAPPTVKDRFSSSHRRLSLQRCSTRTGSCQGQLHQLSRTGSSIHRRLSLQRCSTNCRRRTGSPLHRRLSFQRCSTNCQGQILQFSPKTFAPALLH